MALEWCFARQNFTFFWFGVGGYFRDDFKVDFKVGFGFGRFRVGSG